MAVSLRFELHKRPAPQVDKRTKHLKAPIPRVIASEFAVVRENLAHTLPTIAANNMRNGRYKVR
jgi:hypothetical protein